MCCGKKKPCRATNYSSPKVAPVNLIGQARKRNYHSLDNNNKKQPVFKRFGVHRTDMHPLQLHSSKYKIWSGLFGLKVEYTIYCWNTVFNLQRVKSLHFFHSVFHRGGSNLVRNKLLSHCPQMQAKQAKSHETVFPRDRKSVV